MHPSKDVEEHLKGRATFDTIKRSVIAIRGISRGYSNQSEF